MKWSVERVRAVLAWLVQRFARRCKVARLERQHARSYALQPVQPGEFDIPESEQAWEDK
jgi:hypothetical protein